MNLDIHPSAGRKLALALLFSSTAALSAVLVEKNPDEAARVESLKPGSEIVVKPGAAIKKPGADSAMPQRVTVERASTERDVVPSCRRGVCAPHRYGSRAAAR
jgi:hypothetical protein